MSYYRSYFKKNNTIVKDSLVNTSKNPTTEIFYGDGYSKFIFQVDFTDLQTKITNGELILNTGTTHTLRMTNTIFGSESFVGQEKGTGGLRATSFDLTLFPLSQYWDEGVGSDYERNDDLTYNGLKTYDERPSNWYSGSTLSGWTVEGIYDTIPTGVTVQTIHFDNGNENINVDITDYVNSILSGGTDYGLVMAFNTPFFGISGGNKESVSFFTKYTQTFYEPFVETFFDDRIDDNREDFINEIFQNLYLYVTKNGNYIDLDQNPKVDILNSANQMIDNVLSGMTAEKVRKGVYKVKFGLAGTICDGKRFYYDKWYNLYIDGAMLSDVKQKFVPRAYGELFDIGSTAAQGTDFVIKYSGIKLNEKIKRGELRKITVSLKSIIQSKTIVSDELYYRIYVKEGKLQVNVFDWTKLDKTNENSFLLDTSYLIPKEYFIEIKSKIGQEEKFYNNEIKFEIVSEK